jgi:hypothetical protein
MIFIILLFLLCFSCQEPPPVGEIDFVAQIEKHRREKDASFKISEDSPIPDEPKTEFQGLSYFPIDLNYRFQVRLHRYSQKETFEIVTSSGMLRETMKYGYFKFETDNSECVLQVYKLLDLQSEYPNYLFVPFLDATTGKGSYPGGRYLDFEENDFGIYTLDFNLAYNPSCAYGKAGYNCPIPPAENRLDVAVQAGERYPTF